MGHQFGDALPARFRHIVIRILEIYAETDIGRTKKMRRQTVYNRVAQIDERFSPVFPSGLGYSIHKPVIFEPGPYAVSACLDDIACDTRYTLLIVR